MRLYAIEVAPGLHDHLGAGHLAHVRVRSAEHARFLDARELIDADLDFLGEEFEPGDQDQRLLPALEVERPRTVQKAEIAGEEPAVRRDLLAQPPGRVVGREMPVAPDGDLAQCLRRQELAVVGEDRDLVPGDGSTYRSRR